ncbi:MAG: TMEM175 family protein [Rhodoglobus sp.]
MRTERGFSRLVSFSDGVVAIAITLLVLPLVTSAAEEEGDLSAFLAANVWQLFVFVLSFVVIGRFWMLHHAMYEKLTGYTTSLLWANMLWLLSIVFLPFPTQLLVSVDQSSRTAYALYIGTMIVTSFASLLQQWIASRNPQIVAGEARGTLRLTPSVLTLLVMIVSLALALLVPAIGLWSLLLIAIAGRLERLVTKRNSPASSPTRPENPERTENP